MRLVSRKVEECFGNSVLVLALALAAGQAVFAAELPSKSGNAAVAAKPSVMEVIEQIDAVDRETLDLQAAYWAWRVSGDKDVTYAELAGYAPGWIMKDDTRAELLAKIKKIVDTGEARALTADELKRHADSRKRVRAILAPGSQDKKTIAALTPDYCLELKARYWAGRVQRGEKEILSKMPRWGYPKEIKDKLIKRTNERLKQENAPLTEHEKYESDACTEKMQ